MELNNKHQKTLQEIFENPIKANIPWTLPASGRGLQEGFIYTLKTFQTSS